MRKKEIEQKLSALEQRQTELEQRLTEKPAGQTLILGACDIDEVVNVIEKRLIARRGESETRRFPPAV